MLSSTASNNNNNNKGGRKDNYDLVPESTVAGADGVFGVFGIGSGPSDVVSSDYRRQACVVLMGAAGRHLTPGDPAVTSIAGHHSPLTPCASPPLDSCSCPPPLTCPPSFTVFS